MQAINSVNNVMRQSQSLSFQSSNLQQQLLNKFKGYGTYSSGSISAADMQSKYQQWSDDTKSSIATTMAGLGMQNDQLADEDALMRRLEQMGNTAEWRMKAWKVSPPRTLCRANCLHWVGVETTGPGARCSQRV